MAENKVNNTHEDYDALQPLRDIWDDVCDGTKTMRDKGEAYLPKFPKEAAESYRFRLNSATLQNLTKKTLEILCGLVFQKDITLGEDVPAEVVTLWENIDNKGTHGNVFARDLFEDSFDGSAVIIVDYPQKPKEIVDKSQQQAAGLRPYWRSYDACDVINWAYRVNEVSRKMELSLIVLRESKTVATGMFLRDKETHYHVCYMNGSIPSWQRWKRINDGGKKANDFVMESEGTFGNQKQLPIAIVGELDDAPPLMDLCYKNIEHYQTYSDYKSVLHKCNRPLFYSVNLDGDPTALGSDIWFKCNEGGSIGFAEPAGTSIERTEICLDNIKKEIGQLGLAMLAGKPVKGDTTATEKMLDSIQETSSLQVRATQLKDALELALQFTANYLNEKSGGSIELGCSWAQMALSAQEMTALSNLVDAGQLSLESFLWYLERTSKLPPDVDAKAEMKRIDEEMKANVGVKPVLNAQQMPNETTNQNTPAPTEAITA